MSDHVEVVRWNVLDQLFDELHRPQCVEDRPLVVPVVLEQEGNHVAGIASDAEFREWRTAGVSSDVFNRAGEFLAFSRCMDEESLPVDFPEVIKERSHDTRIGKRFEIRVRVG